MQSAASRCQRLLGIHLSQQAASYALAAGHNFVQASRLAAAFEALTPLRASAFWSLSPSSTTSKAVPDLQPSSIPDSSQFALGNPNSPSTARIQLSPASIHTSTSAAQAAQPQLALVDDEIIFPVEQPVRFPFHARAFFVGARCPCCGLCLPSYQPAISHAMPFGSIVASSLSCCVLSALEAKAGWHCF